MIHVVFPLDTTPDGRGAHFNVVEFELMGSWATVRMFIPFANPAARPPLQQRAVGGVNFFSMRCGGR